MLAEKTWQEFRDTGLLWWINRQLHLFGWVLVADIDIDGTIERLYPARTQWRGFNQDLEDSGFKKLTAWMATQGQELLKNVNDS